MNVQTQYSLTTEIKFLKGVGPKLAAALEKLDVKTVDDLLHYLPRRYEDRANFVPIRSLRADDWATVKGKVIDVDVPKRRGLQIIRAIVTDGTASLSLVWFNQPWITTKLSGRNAEIIAYGQVKSGEYGYQMQSPEWEIVDSEDSEAEFARITPIYPLKESVSQKMVRRAVKSALTMVDALPETLPLEIRKRHKLMSRRAAIRNAHFPESEEKRIGARRRLVFEEFLYLQLAQCMRNRERGLQEGIGFEIASDLHTEIERACGFTFTAAQKKVLDEILADMRSPHPMNRLLQGDVGSGKTAVAAAAMLAAVRANFQAALMAPTEILAEQHAANLKQIFEPIGIEVELLVGKQQSRAKKKAIARIGSGDAHISVGTHALIQQNVNFDRLGLVVIDEQHRFGVMQRGALRRKGVAPDVLVMSATPIPRSLTLTIYGDLDLSVIDELPPGRTPIKTHWKQPNERARVYEGVRAMLQQGAQVYIVCPLVSESEKMQMQAAEDLYKQISTEVFPEFKVGLIHGQLKSKNKERQMEAFRSGETQVLVATSVIEVGVDVPNATIMVIEDANRFGLAQLHQLRGRVGRGSKKSYCVLIGAPVTPDSAQRLSVMVQTNDGFKISEEDLRIRGPGDLSGTRQSGAIELRVADLLRDGALLEEARSAAIEILDADPKLESPDNAMLKSGVEQSRSRMMQTDVS